MRPAFVGIVFATLVGTSLMFWSFTLKPAPKTEPVVAQAVSEPVAPAPPAPVAQFAAEPQPVDELPRPKRIDPEIERMQAIVHAIDQRYLDMPSKAKDTPEAKRIEEMLAKRGIGRIEMPLAYNITWNYNHMLRVTKRPEVARMHVNDLMKRLEGKGPIGEDFWSELFAMQPTVFYGQKDFSMPPEFAQN